MRSRAGLLLLLVAMLFAIALPASAQPDTNEDAVVRVVFFFSPTCGHCEFVITEVLPGVFEQYGGEPSVFTDETLPQEERAFYEMTNGTLDILFADVMVEDGAALYESDTERLAIPDDRTGVPRLVAMDQYYVGSAEIPEQLPGIIDAGLDSGGIPWPDIPGIEEAIAAVPGMAEGNQPIGDQPASDDPSVTASPSSEDVSAGELPSAEHESVADRFGNDPLGNGLAVLVLIAMIASLVAVPIMIGTGKLGSSPVFLIPALAIVGIGVSIYLGGVEASGADAVCGPVGDCNAVQQSEYASIFGIPIGILGIVGYGLLFVGWLLSVLAKGRLSDLGLVLAGVIAGGGTLFSIYLTFLEPFVIGATCMWCLTSAAAITGLLWLTAGPAWTAFERLRSS